MTSTKHIVWLKLVGQKENHHTEVFESGDTPVIKTKYLNTDYKFKIQKTSGDLNLMELITDLRNKATENTAFPSQVNWNLVKNNVFPSNQEFIRNIYINDKNNIVFVMNDNDIPTKLFGLLNRYKEAVIPVVIDIPLHSEKKVVFSLTEVMDLIHFTLFTTNPDYLKQTLDLLYNTLENNKDVDFDTAQNILKLIS